MSLKNVPARLFFFGTFCHPPLFEPACLLVLKETILPARLLKPAPFWILLLC